MSAKQRRAEIKRILALLDDCHRRTFTYMYSPYDTTQDINITVDTMPAKQLEWALKQCETSYHEIFNILKDHDTNQRRY